MVCKQVTILFPLLILFAGCATEQKAASVVELDKTFTLAVGDSVLFKHNKDQLWLYLQQIEDSRCPAEVSCITGGEANAVLRLENKSGDLSFCIGADCREKLKNSFLFEYNNERYNIVLEVVEPYPQTGNEQDIKRALFKIKRATG
jgi:hypothetical protein